MVCSPRTVRALLAGSLASLAAVGLGSARAADPPAARLVYQRGPGAERCPDEVEMRNLVASRLGYDPFRPEATSEIVANLAHRRGVLVARVEVRDASGVVKGTRELSSAPNDCSELASAIALALSIAVDPLSLTRPPPSASAPAPVLSPGAPTSPPLPASSSPPAPPAPPSASSPPEQPPPVPLFLRASVEGHVVTGAAPATTFGAAVGVGVRRGALSLGLEGRADLPATRDGDGQGRVRASLLLGTLVPCFHQGVAVVCALGSVGSLQGSGEGVARPAQQSTITAAAGVRLGAELPLGGPLRFAVHGDLLGTLVRTTLRIDGRAAWISAPLSGLLGASLLGQF